MPTVSNEYPGKTSRMPMGNYVIVNGLELYYEVQGGGK